MNRSNLIKCMIMQGRDKRCAKIKPLPRKGKTVQLFGDNETFSDSFPFAGIILIRLSRVSVEFPLDSQPQEAAPLTSFEKTIDFY